MTALVELDSDEEFLARIDAARNAVLDRYGVLPEWRDVVAKVVHNAGLVDFLTRLDVEALAHELAETNAAQSSTRLHPCSGCQVVLPRGELHTATWPGALGFYCVKCFAAEEAHEARKLARRGIRAALARATRARLPATLTRAEWQRTLKFFDDACAYCGKIWYVVEHVIAIELGGGTVYRNCVPACYACNRNKGQRTLDEMLAKPQPFVRERIERLARFYRGSR
jgi:5-methylcytosine-specific restriction endonuclease McrA